MRIKYRKQKHRKIYIFAMILIFTICSFSIAYAYLTSQLKINGNTVIASNTWNIYFDNLIQTQSSKQASVPAYITDNGTLIEFDVTLENPGDFYEFKVDIINAGTIDAMVNEVLKTGLSTAQKEYVIYDIAYIDGSEITEKDELLAGSMETIIIKIKYRDDGDLTKYPSMDQSLNLNLEVEYVQAEDSKPRPDSLIQQLVSDNKGVDGIPIDNVKSTYVSATTGVNFQEPSSDTNGKGLYIRAGTENDEHPIYYFRGTITNNNVYFAGFCWKIVRTTETGGIKLLYNGESTDKTCNQFGKKAVIDWSFYNTSSNYAVADVGYMYGSRYTFTGKGFADDGIGLMFGNDISYSNGTYTLKDTYTITTGLTDESSIIASKYHYSCFTTGTTCNTVYYIFAMSGTYPLVYTLTGGNNITNAVDYMTKSSSNINSSIIKTKIDSWYLTNIENNEKSKYLEDTPWCSDRSFSSYAKFNKDTDISTNLYFNTYKRVTTAGSEPVLTCNNNDKFTVSSSNGNGALTYPIALVTSDEVMLAGATYNAADTSYLNHQGTGAEWFTMSPYSFEDLHPFLFKYNNGGLASYGAFNTNGIRPAISLTPGTKFVSGDGTESTPYLIYKEE